MLRCCHMASAYAAFIPVHVFCQTSWQHLFLNLGFLQKTRQAPVEPWCFLRALLDLDRPNQALDCLYPEKQPLSNCPLMEHQWRHWFPFLVLTSVLTADCTFLPENTIYKILTLKWPLSHYPFISVPSRELLLPQCIQEKGNV